MELKRIITSQEEKLLELLIKKSSVAIPENWRDGLLVLSMDDGGMGSLLLLPKDKIIEGRVFGEQVSEFKFVDLDGVDVIASLNVDNKGELFELDIWKLDFRKLLKLPDL